MQMLSSQQHAESTAYPVGMRGKMKMKWKHASGESEHFPAGLDNKKEQEAFWFTVDKSCSAQRMCMSHY